MVALTSAGAMNAVLSENCIRRRDESRPMRHEVSELLRVCGSMKRDEKPLRGRGGVADKCEVKAGLVVCACKLRQIARGYAAFNDVQGCVTEYSLFSCLGNLAQKARNH